MIVKILFSIPIFWKSFKKVVKLVSDTILVRFKLFNFIACSSTDYQYDLLKGIKTKYENLYKFRDGLMVDSISIKSEPNIYILKK